MKLISLLILLLAFSACGPQTLVVNRPVPGPSGVPGNVGAQGEKGDKGDTGSQGIPGTSITIVQLCGLCTPVYPNTFPEVGFCIQNQLYGVYSVPNAFMTPIPPGTYSSVGINCSCTIVVSANCSVTQH